MADQNILARVSALSSHYKIGKFGILQADGSPGVTLEAIKDPCVHQIAAWPDSVDEVGKLAALAAGVQRSPNPGRVELGVGASLLRIEPLKWWLLGLAAPALTPDLGATLDLSHSRTQVSIRGREATSLLNRHLPLDLREASFAVGAVASTAFHHVSVTLWRSEDRYELSIPRGFALSLWELLVESAEQFGLEIL